MEASIVSGVSLVRLVGWFFFFATGFSGSLMKQGEDLYSSSSSSHHRGQTVKQGNREEIPKNFSCKVVNKGVLGLMQPGGKQSAKFTGIVCGNTSFITSHCFVRICQVYCHAQSSIWPWKSVVASFLGRVCDQSILMYCVSTYSTLAYI